MPHSVEVLQKKLLEAGIPEGLHAKFIEFQQKHAGKEGKFGLNPAVWGILLDSVRNSSSSAMVPGEIIAEWEDGVWHVVCADIHASDTATIDEYGRLYWSYQPWYSDFNMYFEGREPDLRQRGK